MNGWLLQRAAWARLAKRRSLIVAHCSGGPLRGWPALARRRAASALAPAWLPACDGRGQGGRADTTGRAGTMGRSQHPPPARPSRVWPAAAAEWEPRRSRRRAEGARRPRRQQQRRRRARPTITGDERQRCARYSFLGPAKWLAASAVAGWLAGNNYPARPRSARYQRIHYVVIMSRENSPSLFLSLARRPRDRRGENSQAERAGENNDSAALFLFARSLARSLAADEGSQQVAEGSQWRRNIKLPVQLWPTRPF